MISFLDVRFTFEQNRDEILNAFVRVMESGEYIGGEEVTAFESDFAAYCGTRYCVGLGNGLDALVISLRATGIGVGDEVIVPAHTFIATWLAVVQTGATPVPVDADPGTMAMDPTLVEQAITERSKAIMPVHLYGIPVPCARLRQLADKHRILLIEDAAQAHGARDGDRNVGSLGDAAAFSFYPGKNLGAFGDGGAVVTDDEELADRVRKLANYGSRVKYDHELKGTNSRLDPLQAAFLRIKLKRLDEWSEHRRAIASLYNEELAGSSLQLPQVGAGCVPVWHLYVVRHPKRDELRKALSAAGIPTALHYPVANHRSGAFADEFDGRQFPVTEEICRTCLSLPVGPHLTIDQAHEVATKVSKAALQLD